MVWYIGRREDRCVSGGLVDVQVKWWVGTWTASVEEGDAVFF